MSFILCIWFQIRQSLGQVYLPNVVRSLPLPTRVLDFLLLRDSKEMLLDEALTQQGMLDSTNKEKTDADRSNSSSSAGSSASGTDEGRRKMLIDTNSSELDINRTETSDTSLDSDSGVNNDTSISWDLCKRLWYFVILIDKYHSEISTIASTASETTTSCTGHLQCI